jgi:hypothetical protein
MAFSLIIVFGFTFSVKLTLWARLIHSPMNTSCVIMQPVLTWTEFPILKFVVITTFAQITEPS